jgi:hypothetical protein
MALISTERASVVCEPLNHFYLSRCVESLLGLLFSAKFLFDTFDELVEMSQCMF